MIHPGEPAKSVGFLFPMQLPGGLEASERDVVRGLAGLRSFLADAFTAVDDRRLEGSKLQTEVEAIGDGLQFLRAGRELRPANLPIPIPVTGLLFRGPGKTGPGSV